MSRTESIEARIKRETAAKMAIHNLHTTHMRLQDAGTSIKRLRSLDPALPDDIGSDLQRLVNSIEDVAWRVEMRIIEEGTKA